MSAPNLKYGLIKKHTFAISGLVYFLKVEAANFGFKKQIPEKA